MHDIDIQTIRNDARSALENGPVTAAYQLDAQKVIEALNDVLATETVCALRYRNHAFVARGVIGKAVADEFMEHANQEQRHADMVADRINQLGGHPVLDPATIAERTHAKYVAGDTLRSMIKENLIAERIAISVYTKLVRWLGDSDPTTRRLMETILSEEEEHAEDMASFLQRYEETR